MFGNYIKTAFRNLYKQKLYSLIKIFGLAIGIACFILIFLYIIDELSYDKYHAKSKRIYRLVNVYDMEGVGENSASSPFPVAYTLKQEYPNLVEDVVRIFNFQSPRSLIEHEDNKFNERKFFFADSTFFEIFDYEFIMGDPETALDESFSVVITESVAKKYFGEENPMGKTMKFETRFPLKVTGIIKDIPAQSHYIFDFMASMASVKQMFGGRLPQTWVWNPCWTYILLKKNSDPKTLEQEFPAFIEKYFYDAEKEYVYLYLQPLEDIHLKSALDYEIEPNNNIYSVYILSVIAIFLLVIASINYMNLATATSSGRSREIGIKKVVGAHRKQLVRQFIGESIIITFLALLVAVLLVELILPYFNAFTDKLISLSQLLEPVYLIGLILLGLITGFISGIYPALYLSALKPLASLKRKVNNPGKSGLARKVLVVVQFSISIALIIGTFIAFDQISFMQKSDLGFQKENILIVPINRTEISRDFKTFKEEILQNPKIQSVTACDDIFGVAHNTHEFRPEGLAEDKWNFFPALVVQYDFLTTFGIDIIAGRDYDESHKTDPMEGILVNEALVKHMGWDSPEKALGKKFKSLNGNERIIGVTNNFNVTSLHENAGPFVLNMKEKPREILIFMRYMALKVIPGSEEDVINYLSVKWPEFEKDRPFEYSFLKDELSQLYKDENDLAKLSLIFTGLIIFIAALGLFGLTSYMAEQRTKEIGIRKVLGADILNVLKIMSREFLLLVFIASIIAWPIAYLVMNNWLANFAYRTSINWVIFIYSAVIALLIALTITSIRSVFVYRINPVDTLKYE